MIVEQASRFRADDGYRLVALSSGVGQAEEHALELFSDIVAPLFNNPSDKVVGCLSHAGTTVVAQAASSSDAYGRRAVYTHGLFMGPQAYAGALWNNPEGTLTWLYTNACNFSGQTGDLAALELEEEPPTTACREARERAGLADEATYAAYLKDVASAILFGGSVCFDDLHEVEGDPTRFLSRVACAAYGLPQRLLPALTWSAAFDSRAVICVAGPVRVGTGRLSRFKASDADQSAPSAPAQEGADQFSALARMDDDQRRAYLLQTGEWLDRILPGRLLPNAQILYCAMCLARRDELDGADRCRLLETLLGLLEMPSVATNAVEQALACILQAKGGTAGASPELLVAIARHVAQSPKAELADALIVGLGSGDPGACRVVLASLLDCPCSDSDAQPLVARLIEMLGVQDGSALFDDPELGERALLWYAHRHDCEKEAELCSAYADRQPLGSLPTLLATVAYASKGRRLTCCETALIERSLRRLLSECGAVRVKPLSAEASETLFVHYDEMPEQARQDCVAFYLRLVLRPDNGTRQERLASMEKRFANKPPSQFDSAVIKSLEEYGCEADQSLWQEHCSEYVRTMKTPRAIASLCSSINVFQDPDGTFEQAVVQTLIPMFEHVGNDGGDSIAPTTWSGRLRGCELFVDRLNVSEPTRLELRKELSARCWQAVPLREVVQDVDLLDMADALPDCGDAKMRMCKRFAQAWLCLRDDRPDVQPMERIVNSDPAFTQEAAEEVVATIPFMLDSLAHEGRFSWDLAFIAFVSKDDRGKNVVNAEGLVEMLAGLNEFASLRIEPEERVPSSDNSLLFDAIKKNAKGVKKAARGRTNRYVDSLLSGLDSAKEKRAAHAPAAHMPANPAPAAPAHMDESPYSRPAKGAGFHWPFGKR